MTIEGHIENLKAIASDMPSDKCADWIDSLMAGINAMEELQSHREAWVNVEKELKKENQRFTNKTNFASGYIEGIREALFKIHEHRPKEEDNE